MNKQIDEVKDLTPEPVFKPSLQMQVWLDTAIQLQTENITEIELASKVSAQSYYNWIKKPEFVNWYYEQWENKLKIIGPKLDAIGYKNAKKDFSFWQAMQKRVGRFREEPSTVGAEFKDADKRIRIIVTNGGESYQRAVAEANAK